MIKYSVWLLMLAISAYFIMMFYQWWQTYPTTSVRVAGHYEHTPEEHVAKILMQPLEDRGYWQLSLGQLQIALETLPWIKQARISRPWPGVLDVELKEYLPVARLGELSLIDARGTSFKPKKLPDSVLTLPRLEAKQGQSHEILAQYQQFSSILQPIGVKITLLQAAEQDTWLLQLSNGLEIIVRKPAAEVALKRLVSIYDTVLRQQVIHAKRIDLRYANGFAVAWRLHTKQKNKLG